MNITMGNDEFILYIRKTNHGVGKSNDLLGRQIWEWIRAEIPDATKGQEDQPCRWGDTGPFISESNLPKSATQFIFDRKFLPELYRYLDTL